MKANTKKNSTTKKLVPAAGSLLISAAMLGTSTYAWFTMSREVEVQNIQMTATTPENVQISLGALGVNGGGEDTQATSVSLAMNTGYLLTDSNGVKEPGTVSENWSNLVDISNYYAFGKLIPASSIDGEDIFFTPNANGVGKTVDPNAMFYQAAEKKTAKGENTVTGTGSGTLNATAFTYTSSNDKLSSGAWSGYNTATAWNNTYDDGYYIDIPVWLRTSSTQGAALKVSAYVKDAANSDAINKLAVANSGTAAGEKLYRAVRVAVLDEEGANLSGAGLINLHDGDSGTNAGYGGSQTILNWYERSANTTGSGTKTNANTKYAVDNAGSGSVYAAPVVYDYTNPIITLAKGTGTTFGTAKKVIIRVWLEGEDPDCWNDTAGQDWSINIKFENTTTS